MAPVTNEVLGGTSTQDSARISSNSEPKAAGSVRSDAVSLEVPVKVHGSRPGSAASQSERFEEQTSTMIVFPEGGVLRMGTAVATGQMLVLTNLKSRQDAICRVVKVRTFSNAQSYVEVEFTRPQASYWGVYFASSHQPDIAASAPANAGTRPPQKAPESPSSLNLPPVPHEPSAPEVIENIADLRDTNPAALPTPPAPPAKPVSPFASIGTQEKVQPAAAATRSATLTEGSKPLQRTEDASAESSLTSSAPNVGLGTFSSLRPEENAPKPSASSVATPERIPAGSVADITSLPDLDDVAAAAKVSPSSGSFGVRFEPQGASGKALAAEPRHNWLLVAASIIVLLGAAAGGAWYFHSNFITPAAPASVHSAAQPTQPAQPSAAPTAIQQPTSQEPAASSPAAPISQSGVPNGSVAAGTRNSARDTHSPAKREPVADNSSEQLHLTVDSASAPAASSSAASAASTPAQNTETSMLSTSAMQAHPLTSQRDISSAGDAPVVSGNGLSREAGGLPSMGPSGVSVPPPPDATPQAPVHVGGSVKQPKLISSVMPVYPFAAREANIQGDVVIDTQIGTNGSVTSMKVISGPSMLRGAALNALRRWKYQPSQLDGKPVAVQMLVTIRFRL
jgi:periplasmic protein TonB